MKLDPVPNEQVTLGFKRSPAFAYVGDHSPEILSFAQSNNNLRWVKDPLITFYITCYQTKCARNEADLALRVITSFERNIMRNESIRAEAKAAADAAAPSRGGTGPTGR